MVKNWLKISLKVLNSTTGLGGIAIVIYGVLMIKVWQPDEQGSSYHDFTFPWFFHAFLAVGIALCAITCLGHVAANTANFYCLSSALPKDQSGKFDDFKDFVKSSDYISKGVACLIFLIQGVSVLLATILRTRGTNDVDNYESEDEYVEPRHPLLSRSRSGLWSADPNIV
ncbi:hypothetical protein BUALT_Bualt03G0058300 [Buddleja alternifolia]|uniref:Tetraspanin n=1 Tax=Buddleja alternifolia TaxID=168488 RepID=A0AAV6XYT3_9LAMI|nr:hypothetical protein BUALT_Bualt03G0058300 [Buddleja alternifolia]